MKKIPVSCGIVALLVLAGCMSGMYSSDVSVDHRDDGVSDYTIVESLDVVEFPESMPVVVESRSSTKKGNNELSQFLWLCTLGVVPGFFMEAAIEDVTVKTPLGEMSGSSTVEACYWMGWLPIFLPYPGVADERSSYPQLPNHALENAAHERLVANLVSQFSKEEYKRYAAAHNTPEARATREKKHAEQRRIEEESKRIAEENAKAEA